MNLVHTIGSVFRGRSIDTIECDIQDELEFHVQSITEDLIANGWEASAAKQEAERRFGNRTSVAHQCQSIQLGPLVWLTRISLASSIVALVVIGALAYSIFRLKTQNLVLTDKLQTALLASTNLPIENNIATSPNAIVAAEPQAKALSLIGTILTSDGKPIKGARVLLIHKSWPNQRFSMDNNATESDEKGKYVFEDLYTINGENQFLVTVLADGHEMKSEYISVKARKKANPIDFKLKAAKSIAFQLLGEDKKPLAETDIVLLSRKVGTKEHMIYPASAEDAKVTTDDQGKVVIGHFNEGDLVKFGVAIFDDLVPVELKISKEEAQTILVQKKSQPK